MNKLHIRSATAGIALGIVALAASPAQAAEKVEDSRIAFEVVVPGVDNPCTPEFDDITVTAYGHGWTKIWTAEDGSSRSRIHLGMHLAGEAADGTGYVGSERFDSETRIEDGVASIVADTKSRLTSQGSDPNFDLRYKVRVSFDLSSPSATFEVIKDHAECRG